MATAQASAHAPLQLCAKLRLTRRRRLQRRRGRSGSRVRLGAHASRVARRLRGGGVRQRSTLRLGSARRVRSSTQRLRIRERRRQLLAQAGRLIGRGGAHLRCQLLRARLRGGCGCVCSRQLSLARRARRRLRRRALLRIALRRRRARSRLRRRSRLRVGSGSSGSERLSKPRHLSERIRQLGSICGRNRVRQLQL